MSIRSWIPGGARGADPHSAPVSRQRHHTGNHHQVCGLLHAQPSGIDFGHRFPGRKVTHHESDGHLDCVFEPAFLSGPVLDPARTHLHISNPRLQGSYQGLVVQL